MDFLNKALLQIGDLFRSMTPGARIASALLLAVVLISVGYLFQTGVSGPDAYLMGGARFSASELPAMEAAFAKANLNAYEVQGNQIRVPRGQQAAYMGALADAGALPAHFGDYLMKAVNDSNPFLTGAQRDQRYKTAKQKELAEIIRNMPGIEKAAVMYDEQTRPGLRKEKTMTASVNVKPIGTQLLDESRIGMIRHLVAGAVAGLEPNRVTVIDQNGKAYAAGDSVTGSGLDNPYFETQRKWQLWIEESVHKALAYVPDLTVTASIDLEKELEHSESSLKLDKQADAVAIKSIDSSKSTVDERASQPAGRPGLGAKQPNQPANLAAGAAAAAIVRAKTTP